MGQPKGCPKVQIVKGVSVEGVEEEEEEEEGVEEELDILMLVLDQ